MKVESKRIIRVLIVLCGLFVSLIIYISYFQIFIADKIITNSYNKRQWLDEENIIRGDIVDRKGVLLATTDLLKDNQVRKYIYGEIYSHIIGYSSIQYGKSGLESTFNKELLALNNSDIIGEIKNIITDDQEIGNNVVLTIDHEIQSYAYKLLGDRKGSIILMNPKTGEIYAMISNPTFNPSRLNEDWDYIISNEDSPLLNRATMGLYIPGSTFKIITATAILEKMSEEVTYECEGSVNIEGYVLKDFGEQAHGEINLEEALVHSCNVFFGQAGLDIGEDNLRKVSEKYMFNKLIPFDLKTSKSIFPEKIDNKTELGATSIGQGKILVTPLNMVLTASTIANEGDMVKPILVKEIVNPKGKVIERYDTEILSNVMSNSIAEKLKYMMFEVVERGTGTRAKINGIKVAGKTGTAQNDTGRDHAWFIGFAPIDDPVVSVAVILESSGETGGTGAAPIAGELIKKALQILNN